LVTSESVISAGAIAGSVGLIQGSIDFGVAINNRLPFESPVFASGPIRDRRHLHDHRRRSSPEQVPAIPLGS
jgi:hypothetical protein